VAAKNLNTAQAMITKLELRIERIKEAWAACRFGTFEDGPASPTPDRCGITINFGDGKVTVHEGKLGRETILKLSDAIRGSGLKG
jgi:hypothetical protein